MSIWSSLYPIGVCLEQCQTLITNKWIYYNVISVSILISVGPISPPCSLEGMMLKLKLQYFGHLMQRADSLEKTLMLGGIGGRRKGDDPGWDGWMASRTRWTWVWVTSGRWWWTGRPGVLRFMGSQRVGHDWATELNSSGNRLGCEQIKVLATQLCLTLCNAMDCSSTGSSVHGILQARILKWVDILFSSGSSWPRDKI